MVVTASGDLCGSGDLVFFENVFEAAPGAECEAYLASSVPLRAAGPLADVKTWRAHSGSSVLLVVSESGDLWAAVALPD